MNAYLRSDLDDTICALATPGGTGAIGVIRVSGNRAVSLVNSVFRGRNLEMQLSHTVHLGRIMDDDREIDEALATIFISPKSYTGENTVELGCHGSPYILQRILELLIRKGARAAKPGEFTLRAFLNKKLSLLQAEAVADLIASSTSESHKTAIMQMRGGFTEQIMKLREKLMHFASLVELELDFSEEDVEFASRYELQKLVADTQWLILQLTQSFKFGNAIKNGIPTVIAGKPNAGKSTLLNALVNEERAIVSDISGTTRDTIEEVFVIDGILFRLMDTAGIRMHAQDKIEKMGIERTFEKIQKASIIIYLYDASKTSNEDLQKELMQFEGISGVVIPVANKIDLLTGGFGSAPSLNASAQSSHRRLATSIPQTLCISSLKKEGIDKLKFALVEIVRRDEVKNDIIITNLRHYEALMNASMSLESVIKGLEHKQTTELLAFDIRKAIFHLGEITGEITTDDLLANIFSKFCIGK